MHCGVALIEVRDPLLVTEIESDSQLQALVGARLSEFCIAAQPQAVSDVVARLKALGHMPKVLA